MISKDGLPGCPGCYEAFREKPVRISAYAGSHRYEGDEPKKAEVKEESPELSRPGETNFPNWWLMRIMKRLPKW